MPQQKKENASKRTFRLYNDVLADLEEIAKAENRTVTAQMEVFLREKIREYKKARKEHPQGQRAPALMAA